MKICYLANQKDIIFPNKKFYFSQTKRYYLLKRKGIIYSNREILIS